MSDVLKGWKPPKPSSEHDDVEIRETPVFIALRRDLPTLAFLGDDALIPIARNAIREMWNLGHPEALEAKPEPEMRTFDVVVEVPLLLKFQTQAVDDNVAYENAIDALRKMKLAAFGNSLIVTDQCGAPPGTPVTLSCPEELIQSKRCCNSITVNPA